jgi:hypothetical protein
MHKFALKIKRFISPTSRIPSKGIPEVSSTCLKLSWMVAPPKGGTIFRLNFRGGEPHWEPVGNTLGALLRTIGNLLGTHWELGEYIGSTVENFLGTQWEHGGNHKNPKKISNSPFNMRIILIPKKRLEACGVGKETHWELGEYIGSIVGNLLGTRWEHGGNHQNPNKTSN